MSSLAWFRLLFSRQRRQLARFIPLLSKRSTVLCRSMALPTLTALPLWLIVRAANPVEYANESNRPPSEHRIELAFRNVPFPRIPDLATIVAQLDAMFDKEEFQKAYDYIEKNKNEELFQSHYIQWRVAR
jgi:hypothetical protein